MYVYVLCFNVAHVYYCGLDTELLKHSIVLYIYVRRTCAFQFMYKSFIHVSPHQRELFLLADIFSFVNNESVIASVLTSDLMVFSTHSAIIDIKLF